MDKPEPELPLEERLRWQILIVKQRPDSDRQEESLQMFSHLEWAALSYESQQMELTNDPHFTAWVIALQDNWTSEVLAGDNLNGKTLFATDNN